MRRAFIVSSMVVAAAANAEPLPASTMTVGVGVAVSKLDARGFKDVEPGFTSACSLRLDLAVRLDPHIALGIHGGVTPSNERFDYVGLELGATMQFVFDHGWIAPWFGVSKLTGLDGTFGTAEDVRGAFGIAAGSIVYTTSEGHHVDVFASATRSGNYKTYESYTLGLDWRY